IPASVGDRDICHYVKDGVRKLFTQDEAQIVEAAIDSMFPAQGGGGGGGGSGITNLRIDSANMAIAFTDETGKAGRLPFPELKATPMEFYLDIKNPTPANTTTLGTAVVVGGEYVLPIGGISMTGRNQYITVDRAKNRVMIPQGGLRGTVRVNGAFRWTTSVKDDMEIALTWYCRRAGSSEAWTVIHTGSASRTASQTTAALSFPTSSTYYNLPDYPLECEVRIRFVKVGTTGINWGTLPLFGSESDGVKISMFYNPNYEYTT
ncbi:MAG: hypothetical protein ACRDD7_16040, partial [Peptostreptococcaceae bacterium]